MLGYGAKSVGNIFQTSRKRHFVLNPRRYKKYCYLIVNELTDEILRWQYSFNKLNKIQEQRQEKKNKIQEQT